MSEEQPASQVLDRLGNDSRRSFVKRSVLGMAFAAPVVASFNMDSLTMKSASALTPNGRPDRQ